MIERLITWSIHNRYIVVILAAMFIAWGWFSLNRTPVDAIPDLSENQVIVFTEWMGRSPQIIEDQVTYPLVSNLQGVPQVKDIRAASMFGMSFIYVVFEDEADIYWARTRVLERLNYAQRLLPQGITPSLGPDGTGVGHIFWYTLEAPGYDLGELRALQDWYVKFALQTVPGVSEVASYGGFEKQYQIKIDPNKLTYYGVSLMEVMDAVRANNSDVGGRKYEMSGSALIVRGRGYILKKEDIENISVATRESISVKLKDIAAIETGGELRLGIFDENGEGEVAGGIVVMRYNENAEAVINAVKEKMKEVEKGLPPGVTFQVAYDRSSLIEAAISTLRNTLIEEMIIVSLVILLFLFHIRSSLIVIITLPIAILISFIFMYHLGITSNIMSISGIAIAIGVIVDAAIIMIENTHRHLAGENQ